MDPLFLSVTGTGALTIPCTVAGKAMFVGVSVVGTTPVPASVIVCGLFAALSLIVIVPERTPMEDGVNVIEIVHVAPDATDGPQVFVWVKSAAEEVMPAIEIVGPLFVKATSIGVLAAP